MPYAGTSGVRESPVPNTALLALAGALQGGLGHIKTQQAKETATQENWLKILQPLINAKQATLNDPSNFQDPAAWTTSAPPVDWNNLLKQSEYENQDRAFIDSIFKAQEGASFKPRSISDILAERNAAVQSSQVTNQVFKKKINPAVQKRIDELKGRVPVSTIQSELLKVGEDPSLYKF